MYFNRHPLKTTTLQNIISRKCYLKKIGFITSSSQAYTKSMNYTQGLGGTLIIIVQNQVYIITELQNIVQNLHYFLNSTHAMKGGIFVKQSYLMGSHQIQVAGVRRIKLHDRVDRLTISHSNCLLAYHLHVTIQINLSSRKTLHNHLFLLFEYEEEHVLLWRNLTIKY